MTHTFTSFIRDDEGLRESGCQDWHIILSPPNNTPSEHKTAFCLFPPASTLAIWHATALKAKSVASFTDKGLLPCGFTTWQLRDRGISDGR